MRLLSEQNMVQGQ